MIPALLILMITIVIHNMYRYIMYAWMIKGPNKFRLGILPEKAPGKSLAILQRIAGDIQWLPLREYLNRKP